jgi:hypothetical protein
MLYETKQNEDGGRGQNYLENPRRHIIQINSEITPVGNNRY